MQPDELSRMLNPTYPPAWVDVPDGEHSGWRHYIIYNQSEGFTPAYALVFADNTGDAIDAATEVSGGRLVDGEQLVVRYIEPDSATVRQIQAAMRKAFDGSTDALDEVAEILRSNGYEVSD